MRPTDARACFCAAVRADMVVLNALESVALLKFEPEIPRAARARLTQDVLPEPG